MCDKAILDPFDPDAGTKVYEPWSFYVVQHAGETVLFDTGVHPDLVTDAHAIVGSMADTFELVMEPKHDVLHQLASIGLTPDDVSRVAISHLHFDHATALPLFPHAEVIVQAAELAFARNPPVYQREMFLQDDLGRSINWRVVEGALELFPGATLFPTPGHTPGHQSLKLSLQCGVVLLMADATYLIEKMRARLLPAVVWSPDAMVDSWERIEAIEQEESALLISSHDSDLERVRWAPVDCYE
jgi:glyoxylase-like metal-dependent hydrolase (beta-lactamase superfamily II)